MVHLDPTSLTPSVEVSPITGLKADASEFISLADEVEHFSKSHPSHEVLPRLVGAHFNAALREESPPFRRAHGERAIALLTLLLSSTPGTTAKNTEEL